MTVETKPFKIYRSSAGSGKTYTLVKSYLSVLLKDDNLFKFRSLLAVTFTNKAANEMKERVLQTLKQLSKGQNPLLEDYAAALTMDPNKIQYKAGEIYLSILHHYGDFGILTIDKFVHRIIRSFSRELGLTMNFEIEMDFESFVARSIDEMMSEIGENDALTQYLIKFSEKTIDDSEKGNLEKQLLELSQLLNLEEGVGKLEILEDFNLDKFSQLQQQLWAKSKLLKEKRKEIAVDFRKELNKLNFDFDDFASANTSLLRKNLSAIINDEEPPQLSESAISKALNGGWFTKKHKKIETELLEAGKRLEPFINITKRVCLMNEILSNFTGFSLLNLINQTLVRLKEKNNIVFINDFNRLVSEIVKEEPTPFIYEKIGVKYQNFLIDEFQDTSKLQWINLVPLFHESLSKGQNNLIVGDAKQAIYRWRNGDVDQFQRLPSIVGEINEIEAINGLFDHYGSVLHLDKNYRSYRNIIDFNNWLFPAVAQFSSKQIQDIYKDVCQIPVKSEMGLVEVRLFPKNENSDEDDDDENAIEDGLVYAQDKINECVVDGYRLSDITILVRTNREGIKIASFLQEQGYAVNSAESLVLSGSIEVVQIYNLLKVLTSSNDEETNVKVIWADRHTEDLTEELEKFKSSDSLEHVRKVDINKWFNYYYPGFKRDIFAVLPIYEQILYLGEHLSFKMSNAYLTQLLDTAHNYTAKHGNFLSGFIEFLATKIDKIGVNLGSDLEAIQILTIHKSKGLQFPVVIVPFANWPERNNNSTQPIWINHPEFEQVGLPLFVSGLAKKRLEPYELQQLYDEEIKAVKLDVINMSYVAFTRPEERLYIGGNKKKKGLGNDTFETIETHPLFNALDQILVLGERKIVAKEKSPSTGYLTLPKSKSVVTPKSISLEAELRGDVGLGYSEKAIGNLIHEILAEIVLIKDWRDIFELKVAQKDLLESDKNKLFIMLEKAFKDDMFCSWFGHEATLIEREIVDEKGAGFRPDRVLFLDGITIIVDFKTGTPRSADKKQLKNYAALIAEITLSPVRKYLYYFAEHKIVEV